ncbi:hypothetical protein [Psychrobacter sp. AOP29-E1-7]|uniref:hypothetical protein n=1 Tax=Psychrobacter sp. AOP29-E1-7 TaxID=3457702 RepID=UPI004036E590
MMIYGGRVCHKIASTLTSPALVFSICSDDRFPNELESLILNRGLELDKDIHVVGDLHNLPLSLWRIRYYLLTFVKLKGVKTPFKIFWYDGDLIRHSQTNFFIKNPLHVDQIEIQSARFFVQDRESLDLKELSKHSHFEQLKKIIDLTQVMPSIELDSNSNIIGLDFLKGDYPLNIASSLRQDQIENILLTISELSSLKTLKFPFIKGLQIQRLPERLEVLDIRGCENFELYTALPPTLLKINVAACSLTHVPNNINTLPNLSELMIYKNYISNINTFDLPKTLRRISIYRNNIKEIHIDFDYLHCLEILNIGANPLKIMSLASKKADEHQIQINSRKLTRFNIKTDGNINLEIL